MRTEKLIPTTYILNYQDLYDWSADTFATDESRDPMLISLNFQFPVKDIRMEYRQEQDFTPFERKYHIYMMMLGIYNGLTYFYRAGDYSYWKEYYETSEAYRTDDLAKSGVDFLFKSRMKRLFFSKIKKRYYSRALELALEEFFDRLILDGEFTLLSEDINLSDQVMENISHNAIFEFHHSYDKMLNLRSSLLTEEEKYKMYKELNKNSDNELWEHLEKWWKEINVKNHPRN